MKRILLLLLIFFSIFLKGEEQVTLYLLDSKASITGEDKFWIDWSNHWIAVSEKKEIRGEEAENIIVLLRTMLLPDEAEHFCGHWPVYGVKAHRSDGMELKTSLCFDCLTWVKPNKRMSISGDRGLDNLLCIELQKHIKLPTEANK